MCRANKFIYQLFESKKLSGRPLFISPNFVGINFGKNRSSNHKFPFHGVQTKVDSMVCNIHRQRNVFDIGVIDCYIFDRQFSLKV
jgi:hypothetical protein